MFSKTKSFFQKSGSPLDQLIKNSTNKSNLILPISQPQLLSQSLPLSQSQSLLKHSSNFGSLLDTSLRHFSSSNSSQLEKKIQDEDIIMDEEEDLVEKSDQNVVIEQPKIKKTDKREHLEFQTETKQLLEIVATALYTDKDVFIRELISNASDALEKLRQVQLKSEERVSDLQLPLRINIIVDEKNKQFCIEDTGIGMTKEELIDSIGTIAKSGSKSFIQKLKDAGSADTANIIGQFGVGFYSSFMVSDNVRIFTKSYKEDSPAYCWESHGGSSYNIYDAEGATRGTKIILDLKDKDKEFSMKDTVERIIKKYSNFVQYPIYLNGSKVSTLDAIWLRNSNEITPEEHKRFYQFINRSGGEPLYTFQFKTDVPLNIHSLFYIPSENQDTFGTQSSAPDINVYSKKVLIKAKHREILPEWLRFVKGAVDSEELPLNISRESLQNSPLVRRINGILTRKILSFLSKELKENRDKYSKFYDNFHIYLKEGILQDFLYKDEIASLLIFKTTKSEKYITLEEYVKNMKPDQKDIYFVVAPSKTVALQSPYFEPLQQKGYEVILLQDARDEAVMTTIMSFEDKDIISIEQANIEIEAEGESLTQDQVQEMSRFFKGHIKNCKGLETTSKLAQTPAIIKDPETSIVRHMRRIQARGQPLEILPQTLLIDPRNPFNLKLYKLISSKPDKAKIVANQLFDQALIGAGFIDDARYLLPSLRELLNLVIDEESL